MILGGIWPDLAASAHYNRDRAHAMGADFYRWCQEQAPEGLPFARGVLGHGLQPPCVDYYADECWEGGDKGWCFQIGKKYEQEVGAATGLGPDYAWWKAHNFVELCCEMITDQRHPGLGQEILAATQDREAAALAGRLLAAYDGCDPQAVRDVFRLGGKFFALTDLSPWNLAEKQKTNIMHKLRLEELNCDVAAMARLLQRMRDEIEEAYDPFMEKLIALCGETMSRY